MAANSTKLIVYLLSMISETSLSIKIYLPGFENSESDVYLSPLAASTSILYQGDQVGHCIFKILSSAWFAN